MGAGSLMWINGALDMDQGDNAPSLAVFV
ncbi:hypothetical protein RCCS2_05774 [Roseobacter sp. CCS2]|nr:hypothetical protein RCCS2_05774 [Roseobacter sp. CCS2]